MPLFCSANFQCHANKLPEVQCFVFKISKLNESKFIAPLDGRSRRHGKQCGSCLILFTSRIRGTRPKTLLWSSLVGEERFSKAWRLLSVGNVKRCAQKPREEGEDMMACSSLILARSMRCEHIRILKETKDSPFLSINNQIVI